jgi:hypothetical protein
VILLVVSGRPEIRGNPYANHRLEDGKKARSFFFHSFPKGKKARQEEGKKIIAQRSAKPYSLGAF